MDLHEALTDAFDHTTKVLSGVSPDALDRPTPCTEWDLRTLLAHMLGVVANMGRGARDEPLSPDDELTLDADLASQFRTVADGTLAAWATRAPDDMVNVGAGPMPAMAAMSINLLDTAVHSWDVARSTGQDGQLSPDLATTVLRAAHGIVNDDIRAFAGFAPPVPVADDANPTDRLVAFLGRRP
jgi:uncharacterized protein (TIGR03086 family)